MTSKKIAENSLILYKLAHHLLKIESFIACHGLPNSGTSDKNPS